MRRKKGGTETPDHELVALYIQQSEQAEEAYNEIVSRHYRSLVLSCKAYLRNLHNRRIEQEGLEDTARDITHDFLVDKLPAVLRQYDKSRGSLATWLNRCLINFATDRLRSRPKGIIESFQLEEEEWKSHRILIEVLGEVSPHQERDLRDAEKILQKHLSQLPDHYRRPIELRFWQDMQVQEIAKELRLPLGTVKSQLSRGLEILRQRLRAEGWDRELR